MLPRLLLRDWRLHRTALIPFLLAFPIAALVVSGGQGRLNPSMTLWLAAVLPQTLHFRELQHGTLGDLLALPIPRGQVVLLRYVETLLAAAFGLLLTVLVGYAMFRTWPSLASWSLFCSGMWVLLVWLGALLPLSLRWGQAGWGAGVGLVFLVALLRSLAPYLGVASIFAGVERALREMAARPWAEALLLSALFTLAYRLAVKAFESKDA